MPCIYLIRVPMGDTIGRSVGEIHFAACTSGVVSQLDNGTGDEEERGFSGIMSIVSTFNNTKLINKDTNTFFNVEDFRLLIICATTINTKG
jgi:hypothetical protein